MESLEALLDARTPEALQQVRAALLELLRDPAGAEEHERGIELTAHPGVMNDELGELLVSMLEDQRHLPETRVACAEVLAEVTADAWYEDGDHPCNAVSKDIYDRFVGALIRAAREPITPTALRQAALHCAAGIPAIECDDLVEEAWASHDPAWQLTAVRCMARLHGFDDAVVAALAHDNAAIREAAVIAAGRRGVQEAWPVVSALLIAPETPRALLLAALDGGWNIAPNECLPLLARHLASEDAEVARAAAQAIELCVTSAYTFSEALKNPEFRERMLGPGVPLPKPKLPN